MSYFFHIFFFIVNPLSFFFSSFFFFNDTATTEIYTLSLHDALPIWSPEARLLMSTALGPRLREPIDDAVELTRQFFAQHLARVPFQLALFAAVFALARQARARARRRTELSPS